MRILVINLGWEQEPLIQKLAQRGVTLYGIHHNKEHITSVPFQEIKVCDLRDLESILSFAKEIQPQGVISDNCDYSLFAQALIGEAFNLPAPSIRAAQIANNKFLQRKLAKKHGVTIPKFKLCTHIEDLNKFVQKNSLPIIVKPVDNRGSFGVRKVTKKEELKDAYEYALIHSNSRLVLAEDFIDGKQITIDGYCFPKNGVRSLAIGDKDLVPEDGEVATTISYPSKLPKKIIKKALEINETVNTAFGYSFGMTHSEYMIKGKDIYLIESTNRGGGVFTSSLVAPYSSDIDLLEQFIDDILGKKRDLYKKSKHKTVLLKFFRFPPLGKIKEILDYETIENDKRVLASSLMVNRGDSILPITNDGNRHGFMIFKGKNTEAEELLSKMRIVFA